MPPCYDIYGFSKKRDSRLVEKFLNKFAFRTQIENWEGCELEINKNDRYGVKENIIPVKTLTEVIEYGVKNQNQGFSFYLGPKGLRDDTINLILKFTYDSAIIYGLSIEANIDSGEDNFTRAIELEKSLKELLPIEETSIQFEYAPADDLEDFNEGVEIWRKMYAEQRKM